jgi:hypothetical protein
VSLEISPHCARLASSLSQAKFASSCTYSYTSTVMSSRPDGTGLSTPAPPTPSPRSSGAASSSSAPSTIGTIEFANPFISVTILFLMWLCYSSGTGAALPHVGLEWMKSAALVAFRFEVVFTFIFWAALLAHVYEGALAYRFARKINSDDAAYVAFWTVQTSLVGFPSLTLLKRQRAQQVMLAAKRKQ